MYTFRESILIPETWFQHSWQLFYATKEMFDCFLKIERIRSEQENYLRVGTLKGSMLLLSLALENAIKGAIVQESPPDLDNGKLSTRHFSDKGPHNLSVMIGKLDIKLAPEESKLLNRLTIFSTWAAKYQAPLNESEFNKEKSNIECKTSDFETVKQLIDQLQIKAGYDTHRGWLENHITQQS